MATVHNLYTVGQTAIPVTPTMSHSGMDITIQNTNVSGYLYVGNESVTSSNYGYRILPNHAISFELPANTHLSVVASAADMKAAVIYMGLESNS
jgi:hypothetical protein